MADAGSGGEVVGGCCQLWRGAVLRLLSRESDLRRPGTQTVGSEGISE